MWPKSKRAAILQNTGNQGETSASLRRPLPITHEVLGSFSAKSGLVIVVSRRVALIQVTTCLRAAAATHRNRRHGRQFPFANAVRTDPASAAGLQSHWSGTLDDLPTRIRTPVSVPCANRSAGGGLGGSGGAELAGGANRAASGERTMRRGSDHPHPSGSPSRRKGL